MSYFALVLDGVVRNVAISEGMPPAELVGEWVHIPDDQLRPGPFWLYEDGVFKEPPPEPTPPLPPKTISRLEVINLLGDDYAAIITAGKTDVNVEIWLEKFRLQNVFTPSKTETQELFQFLVTKNLITQEKLETILNS